MMSLKIAIINEICTAGAARCAHDLEQHLSARHIVRYYPRKEQQQETIDSLLTDLADFRPDIVHCHSFYGDIPYRFLAIVSHVYPTCFTPHDPRPFGTMHHLCWACPHATMCFRCLLIGRYRKFFLLNPYFWQRLKKRYVHWRAADHLTLIAPGKWMEERFRTLELRRFPIHYIPYSINIDRFRPIPNARQLLGLSESSQIILHVAHPVAGWMFDPRKGLAYLADAFVNIIAPKYPNALLIVAGEKVVPNHPQVKPVGFIAHAELPAYYSAADVFVAPTLADSFTYTLKEAMGCGTPVVASKVGGIPEGVEHGVTGYLVPPANAQALGDAIVEIFDHPEQAKQMGAAGRQHVERHFDIETFIRKHEEVYQQMIANYQ